MNNKPNGVEKFLELLFFIYLSCFLLIKTSFRNFRLVYKATSKVKYDFKK